MERAGKDLMSPVPLHSDEKNGKKTFEMAVGYREGVYHAHLRRSSTEGAPANRR